MDLSLLKQADRALSKCGGRPILREGSVVPLYKAFLMPMVLSPGQTVNFVKEITGDALWELRAISSATGMNSITGARLQVQLPTGRFLFGGNGMDCGQFAWIGSYRYLIDPPEECEPGSKIQVALSDYTGLEDNLAVNLLFEGVYKFYLKAGEPVQKMISAQDIPRYQAIVNENILAPAWMAGFGPATPQGYRDERFTYSSAQAAIPLAGPLTTTLKIPIDAGLDFVCRRLLFDVEQDDTVTAGTILARVRTGTGFALNDNFIDLAQYLNGTVWPHDWLIRGGDAVYLDLVLVDFTGTGKMYFQAHLEGCRRRNS